MRFFLPGLAAGLLALAIYHVVHAAQVLPRPTTPAEPPRSAFSQTVGGAGIIEAWTENISIGTPLPGVVLEVYVPVEKVGQTVKKGDPLFLVDNRQLLATLKYNEANLRAARAQLAKLEAQPRPEEVPPIEAKVRVAEANVDLQRDLAERGRRLRPTGAMAVEDASQRSLALAVARQQLAQAKAEDALLKAGAWRFDKDIASAGVALAEAQVLQTRTDLERVLVRAPRDGVVLQVNVREGEYVGTPPGQALMLLGAINDKVHVRVDVDEHDIPRFVKGARASASPRGHAAISYPLRFERVETFVIPKKSLTGDNTERVDTRVLQVIYSMKNDGRVYVGQQMDVFIDAGADAGKMTSPQASNEDTVTARR
jgi:multidrug efflux pump subunit AcrA (membrane-fusion protein)